MMPGLNKKTLPPTIKPAVHFWPKMTEIRPKPSMRVVQAASLVIVALILKPCAMPLRGHAEMANESTPQTIHRAKAAKLCDSLGGKVSILHLAFGLVEADSLHILMRCFSKLIHKQASKIPLAHPNTGRERLEAEVFGEVSQGPFLRLPDSGNRAELRLEMRAELRLSAGTLEKHD